MFKLMIFSKRVQRIFCFDITICFKVSFCIYVSMCYLVYDVETCSLGVLLLTDSENFI